MGTFRFLLAFNVIFYHLLKVPNIGALAVYSFFILSGFLMTYIMHHTYSYDLKGVLKYGLNRFWRIFPVYWVLLIFSLMLFVGLGSLPSDVNPYMQVPFSLQTWLANVSIIYPSIHPVDYPVRVSPASWALTIEIFFYLMIGIGLSRNVYISWGWFIASIFYLAYSILTGNTFNIGYGTVFAASLPFSIGALCYFYQNRVYTFFIKLPLLLPMVVAALLVNIIASGFSVQLFGDDWAWKYNVLSVYINLFFSALLVVYLSKIRLKKYYKLDKLLGDLSYPIYVFHWSGAYVAYSLIGQYNTYLGFAFAVVFTLLVSWLINHLIMTKIDKIRDKVKSASSE